MFKIMYPFVSNLCREICIIYKFCRDLDIIRYRIIGSGSLLVENVIESDAGAYMCRAQNSEDSVDTSATVDILGKLLFS